MTAHTLRDAHDQHVSQIVTEAHVRLAAKLSREKAEREAEFERTRAEFDEMARWKRSAAGIAFQARADAFRAAEMARHDERFVQALIAAAAS